MVELVLAKDWVRVRFPAPAQKENNPSNKGYFLFVRASKQTALLASGNRKGSPLFLSSYYCEKMGNLYWSCNDRFPGCHIKIQKDITNKYLFVFLCDE